MANSKVTLLNQSAAGTGTVFACDWQVEPTQQRRIFVTMNAADSILVEGSPDGVQWTPLIAAFTGSVSGFLLVEGLVAYIRATKTGAAGNALVTGLI
jgi:hypothetical protein